MSFLPDFFFSLNVLTSREKTRMKSFPSDFFSLVVLVSEEKARTEEENYASSDINMKRISI